jgi:hypothetical protein
MIKYALVFGASVFAAFLSQQFVDEFKAWTPWLIRKLISTATSRLPVHLRDRFLEEWQSHVNEVPGQIGKLVVAFGYLPASMRMSSGRLSLSRPLDILISMALLFMFSPLFVVVAIAIKFPVFYCTTRIGKGGRRFTEFKFRLPMVYSDTLLKRYLDENPGGFEAWKHSDPHVTFIGRFMQRTSIDELPQLFNVLRGDMTLFSRPSTHGNEGDDTSHPGS